jgi:hypothetical protein
MRAMRLAYLVAVLTVVGCHPDPDATCKHLPSTQSWDTISSGLNGAKAQAVLVDPHHAGRVWLGTEKDNIWRSDDCGSSWTQAGHAGEGRQWSMQADPQNADVLYVVSAFDEVGGLWKTDNAGKTWEDALAGTAYLKDIGSNFVNNVSIDPENPAHVVVSTHGTCTGSIPNCLGETDGEGWHSVKAPGPSDEERVVIVMKGEQWIWCGSQIQMTQNSGDLWIAVGSDCEAAHWTRSFVPVNGNYYLGTGDGVVSSSDGKAWTKVSGTRGNSRVIAQGSKSIFAANSESAGIYEIALDGKATPDMPSPADGISSLAYDEDNHILYASLANGAVQRLVVP